LKPRISTITFGEIRLMKQLPVLLVCLFVSGVGYSQHYYYDIISNQQSNANYKLLRQTNVSVVKGISYEADNSLSENFALQQELSRDKKTLTTTTTNTNNFTTTTISYYQDDRLIKTTDNISTITNSVDYQYDAKGRLTLISTQSVDPEHNGSSNEVHQWIYKENGTPDHMLKIKNKSDTVTVEFNYDEKGNVAEERWRYKNRTLNTYYYYYNDNGQLTDIVSYNAKVKKMLPEITFDYDSNGRINQMLQTVPGSTNYMVWKYTYDERGLKQKDVCFNKNKQQVGRVEYTYSRQ
jgi:hypothetical protein